ncbi:Anoctamin-3 [Cichlidogyrus casuarinus]|uniref:Anoctamin n=1 Tax=Cichlidogyrus casuarinus TaxID=1844966 RepID=A0ABD2PTK5_9PLAT
MFEIRCDAYKFLHQLRRSPATRCKDIGIWMQILLVLSQIAVRSNAIIIAFTTQFVQRTVYDYVYRPPELVGYEGYMNFTMSLVPCARFLDIGRKTHCDYCHYPDFRNPPGHPHAYEFSKTYWHILAIKFIFVFFFENIVLGLTYILSYVLPDFPRELSELMRREAVQTNELLIQAEMEMHKDDETVIKKDNNNINLITFIGANREKHSEYDYGEDYEELQNQIEIQEEAVSCPFLIHFFSLVRRRSPRKDQAHSSWAKQNQKRDH